MVAMIPFVSLPWISAVTLGAPLTVSISLMVYYLVRIVLDGWLPALHTPETYRSLNKKK
jgi:hypothetical protein